MESGNISRTIALVIALFPLSTILLNANPGSDSTAKIIGKVQLENETDYPPGHHLYMGGINVLLYYHQGSHIDSLFTTTDAEGRFYFRNITPQRIGLKISHTSYEEIVGLYDVEAGENAFYFSLKRIIKTLDAAKIEAEVPLIRQLEDTTIFNTQAVKSIYDESLRGVLERLPGFQVSDNRIFVDGEEVRRTYVNGTLVFGDRVTSAIDALKADEVRQVKVYDELSAVDRHRDDKNAQKIRVLDIITKKQILKMDIASAGAAAGADFTPLARYAVGAGAAHHSEMLETHALVSTNNINLPNDRFVSEADANKMISQTEPLDAYKENLRINLSVDKYWKNRDFGNKMTASYIYSRTYSKSVTTALKQYFEGEGSPAQSIYDTLSNTSRGYKHQANLLFSLNDTPIKSIILNLDASISDDNNNSLYGNLTRSQNLGNTRIHQDSGSKSRNYDAGFNLSWANNDNLGWRPSIGLNGGVSNNNSLSWNVDTMTSSFTRRKLNSDGYGRSAFAQFVALNTFMITRSGSSSTNLSCNFISTYNYSRHKQLSLDEFDVQSPVMDMANSFDYTRNQLKNELTVVLANNSQGRSFNGFIKLESTYLFNIERIPDDFKKNKCFTAVTGEFYYHIPSFNIVMNSTAITPAIEQISNRVSDTNPLSLVAGNPELKQAYQWYASVQYAPRTKKKNSVLAGINARLTVNPIVASIRYFSKTTLLDHWDGYIAQPGSMLHTFDNSNLPRLEVNTQLEYSGLAFKRKFNYKLALYEGYVHGPIYYGSEIVPIDDNSIRVLTLLQLKPSKSLSFYNNLTLAHLFSSRKGEMLSSRIRFSETFRNTWFITPRLKMAVDYTLIGYHYLGGIGQDHYQQVLNSGLDVIILKGRNLTVGVWGYDLLNSGSLYNTEINSAMMSQTWAPTYGRNLMFKIVYSFRKK